MTSFVETEEQQALRKAVSAMAANYGQDYYLAKARADEHTDDRQLPRFRQQRAEHRPIQLRAVQLHADPADPLWRVREREI